MVLLTSGPAGAQGNGINVGTPKVFDDRSLELMLEDLNAQLQALRVIDRQKVVAGLGSVQGSSSRTVERSGQISQTSLPGLTRTREPDSEGNLATTKEVETSNELSSSAPDLGATESPTSPLTDYGIQGQDLLSEQINLQ